VEAEPVMHQDDVDDEEIPEVKREEEEEEEELFDPPVFPPEEENEKKIHKNTSSVDSGFSEPIVTVRFGLRQSKTQVMLYHHYIKHHSYDLYSSTLKAGEYLLSKTEGLVAWCRKGVDEDGKDRFFPLGRKDVTRMNEHFIPPSAANGALIESYGLFLNVTNSPKGKDEEEEDALSFLTDA